MRIVRRVHELEAHEICCMLDTWSCYEFMVYAWMIMPDKGSLGRSHVDDDDKRAASMQVSSLPYRWLTTLFSLHFCHCE